MWLVTITSCGLNKQPQFLLQQGPHTNVHPVCKSNEAAPLTDHKSIGTYPCPVKS